MANVCRNWRPNSALSPVHSMTRKYEQKVQIIAELALGSQKKPPASDRRTREEGPEGASPALSVVGLLLAGQWRGGGFLSGSVLSLHIIRSDRPFQRRKGEVFPQRKGSSTPYTLPPTPYTVSLAGSGQF